jgi:hypothetical protein
MARKSEKQAVAERTKAHLTEKAERRRQAAAKGAETRRQRREATEAAPQGQEKPDRATRANVGPKAAASTKGEASVGRRTRVHSDLLTIALRGEFAGRIRSLSETTGLNLAVLLRDMYLVYQKQIDAGYSVGARLGESQG